MDPIEIDEHIVLSDCLILRFNQILLLYRNNHNHWETPGGKVKPEDCKIKNNCSLDDLKTAAEREAKEELGNILFAPLQYFGVADFKIPSNKNAYAHKFLTSISSGTPIIAEPDTFSKLEYIPLSKLNSYPISPDFGHFVEKLKRI